MKYRVTVDDVSPLVKYGAGWKDATPVEAGDYFGKSYHSTNSNSSSASFAFTGTAVTVFGSKGSDHGRFIVSLDGSESVVDGFNSSNVFQTPLFSQSGLQYAHHAINITNLVQDASRPWLYLDYIEFETGLDDNVANAFYNVDDTNSTFSYTPAGAWDAATPDANQYYGGTDHTSKTPAASVQAYFDGNGVYVFGTVGPDQGTMSITIDENATREINASSSAFRPQTLLFYSNDFTSGRHSLVMQVLSTAPVDLDYLTIVRWSDNNGLGEGKALTPIIAGSICGALVLLAWLTYLVHWSYTRRQKRKHMTEEMVKATDTLVLREQKKKASQGSTGDKVKSRENSGSSPVAKP